MSFSAAKLYFNRTAVLFLLLSLTIFPHQIFAQKKKSADVTNKNNPENIISYQSEFERQAETKKGEDPQAPRKNFETDLRRETVENILSDNTDGEDLEIRRAAVSALGTHAGTVVVMESQTGKILSVVNQNWAIRKGFKPCSTIKLVTGVAGLNERLIDAAGEISSRPIGMDLTDALAFSNNSYFQRVGVNFGNEKMVLYARMLGLGEATGINADNESAGKLPYGNTNPRIYSHGDDFEVTPLQLAVMVSAISNGGKLVVPQIPRTRAEKVSFRGMMRRQVNLPSQNFQGVLPGMIGAVTYGTAKRSNGAELNVAGKTGSCIGQGSWLGLFASVAPAVNPKYTVVVITRGQAERGKFASAIAGKIYQSLAKRINDSRRDAQFAKVQLDIFKPKPKVNAQTSAKVDFAQGEDSDDGDVNKAGIKNNEKAKSQTVVKSSATTSNTKNPQIFSPVVINVKRNPEQTQTSSPFVRPRIVKTVSSSRIMD